MLRLPQRRSVPHMVACLLGFAMVVGGLGCGTPEAKPAVSSPPASSSSPAPTPSAKAAAPAAPAKSFDAAQYFAGKTVTLMIAWPPGDGVDVAGRQLAPFLAKYIPGKPNLVIENRPGASGVSGANFFFKGSKPDGLTILYTGGLDVGHAFRELTGAEYDATKMPILGALGEGLITLGSTARGLKSGKDVYKANRNLFVGIRGLSTSSTLAILSQLGLMETKVVGVNYPGGAPEGRLAVYKGEADIHTESTTAYMQSVLPEVQKGTVVALWQTGLLEQNKIVRDKRAPDVPSIAEVYEQTAGKAFPPDFLEMVRIVAASRAITRIAAVPPNTPPEVVEALRDAANKAFADPDFLNATKLNNIPMPTFDGKGATAAAQPVLNMSKDVSKKFADLFAAATASATKK